MIANKDGADWASTTYSQGAGETDWKEYQTELTFVGRSIALSSTRNTVNVVETQPNGIIVNNSGTLTGINSPTALSGFQLSTFTNTAQSNVFSGINFSRIDISGNGQYLFGVYNNQNLIRRYTLSTPGDITTLSTTENQTYTPPNSSNSTFVAFRLSLDGTKIYYLVNTTTDYIYQATLSTPWDLTTAGTPVIGLATNSYGATPMEFAFTNDGRVLYFVNNTSDIYKFNLSTPWSLTTATYASDARSIYTQVTNNARIVVAPNKQTIFATISNTTDVYTYNMKSDGALSSALVDLYTTNSQFQIGISCLTSLNNKIYLFSNTTQRFHEYTSLPVNKVHYPNQAATTTGQTLTTSGQDGYLQGIAFSAYGHKLYFIGDTNNKVYQYNLSTPWEITSASASVEYQLSNLTWRTLVLSEDGTKLYVGTTSTLYQHTLTTPWEINTATAAEANIAASSLTSVYFSPDGLKLFLMQNSTIFRYSLSTAWNISTAGNSDQSLNISTGATNVVMAISRDGLIIYVTGYDGGFSQIRLRTPWTFNNELPYTMANGASFLTGATTSTTGPQTLFLSREGTRIYSARTTAIYQKQITYSNNNLWIYDTCYDTTAANLAAAPTDVYRNTAKQWSLLTASETVLNTLTSTITPVSATVGSATLSFDNTLDPVFETYDYVTITPSLAPNVSTLSYASLSGTPTGVGSNNGRGLKFSPDGTKLFVVQSNGIFKYNLSSAWSITSIPTAATTTTVSYPLNNITDITLSPDGTKLFTITTNPDTSSRVVVQYNLPSAWDISSFSSTTQLAIAGATSTLQGIDFSADGTRMFVIRDGSSIATYTLSTPYTISTATVLNTFTLTNANTLSLRFSLNGSKMYVLRASNIDQYNLSTAWNPATATYIGTLSTSTQTVAANGLDIHIEGNKFYVMSDSPTVYQYNSSDSLVTQTAQINSISVANSQTTINFTEQLYPVYVAVSGRSAAQPGVQFELASGNVTVKSDKIALPNGKRFAKVKITGDYGDDIVNAKLNLWKA